MTEQNNNFAHDHAVPYGYDKSIETQQDNKSYLIKTTTHITGEVFHDVIPIRDNERYEFVTADTRYQAINKFKDILYVYLRMRDTVTNVWYGIRSVLEKIPVEHRYKLLKDVK